MHGIVRSLPLALILALAPTTAFAYIDPGLVSTLIQGVFALLFGGVAAFIFRPWQSIKSFFGRSKPATNEQPERAAADENHESAEKT